MARDKNPKIDVEMCPDPYFSMLSPVCGYFTGLNIIPVRHTILRESKTEDISKLLLRYDLIDKIIFKWSSCRTHLTL